MKVGDAVKFPGSDRLFAVVLKEEAGRVALMFKDGEIGWFQKNKLSLVSPTACASQLSEKASSQ